MEDSSTTKLEIRISVSNNGLALPDASLYIVKSSSDVINLMKLGEVNRTVNSTALTFEVVVHTVYLLYMCMEKVYLEAHLIVASTWWISQAVNYTCAWKRYILQKLLVTH